MCGAFENHLYPFGRSKNDRSDVEHPKGEYKLLNHIGL